MQAVCVGAAESIVVVVNAKSFKDRNVTPECPHLTARLPEVSRRCTVVHAELVKPPVPRAAWTSVRLQLGLLLLAQLPSSSSAIVSYPG